MRINLKQLGSRIRFFRKKANLTQEELAELTDLSVQYIGYLENGKRGASLKTIIDIANTLGTTLDPLFLGNLDCEIAAHICEFEDLIVCRSDEERNVILDAAIEMSKILSQNVKQFTHSLR